LLDLGAGYGALGLFAAARFPRARGLLVDRDLLAVEYARKNAALQGAALVEVAASLGYRDLPPGWGPFDWILSNFPARAGERVFSAFLSGGTRRLAPGGEMRVVVIAPLGPMLERAAAAAEVEARRIAEGSGHIVFAIPPSAGEEPGEEVYERDCIRISLPETLRLVRPSDLADEPHRLRHAVPLLAAALPGTPPARVLLFRSGYGLLPALVLERYPASRVVSVDRDLLGAAFTRRNCPGAGDRLLVEPSLHLAGAARHGPFDLVAGELSPPLGRQATLAELGEAREMLSDGGKALLLGLSKQWRESLRPASSRLDLRLLAESGPAALFEMRRC
jgi:16S rRNA G1207 methylase RsmC